MNDGSSRANGGKTDGLAGKGEDREFVVFVSLGSECHCRGGRGNCPQDV